MNGFIVSAILCVVLSFVIMGQLNMGVWGLIIAQIISQAVYNLWKWPIKAHREMELSVDELIKIGTKKTVELIYNFLPEKR